MEEKMDEDILYIARFLNGENDGFEALVRKYQDRVLNIVYALIGSDRESEDISQEAFIKVYHNLRFFRRQSKFSTWLYRIVVNTTYDFLRKRKNFVSDELALKNSLSGSDGPSEALQKKEREAAVERILEKIPLKYRVALVFKDIDGLSYDQISDVLSCSIGTVESRIYRGRQFIREELRKVKGEVI